MSTTNGHDHSHEHSANRTRLWLAIGVTLLFMVVEVVGGILTGSLALISDAGHMFTHAFALGITLFAMIWATRPPTPTVSYGYHRTEILAALINGLTLLAVTAYIIYEAIMRLVNPVPVDAMDMLWVALAGLGANLISAMLLAGGQKGSLNIRSAFIHMLTDLGSSVAIVLGAGAIYFWNLVWLDPVLSLVICLLIVRWSWSLLAQSTRVLMEAAPPEFDLPRMIAAIKAKYPSITDLHHIHIWSINENQPILTAHVVTRLESMKECTDVMVEIQDYLQKEFGIVHSVLQMESDTGEVKACSLKPHTEHDH
jgi:cobalt-zinc-cadmium efflux system protein